MVIQPEQILEDIEYWRNHALICKFLGLRLSLSVLDSWARRVWNPEGDMEILLVANNYFMVIFSSMADRNKAFEGGPYFLIRWGYSSSLGIRALILLRKSPLEFQCGFACRDFLWNFGGKTFFTQSHCFLGSLWEWLHKLKIVR